MKMNLEFDPLNESEVREAHAILTILGGDQPAETKPGITASPEDRKDPAAEKAEADAKAKSIADAAAKNKADAAAAKKKADDAKAEADAATKAAADAKREEDNKAFAEQEADAPEEDDSFLDGGGDDAPTYTIEDVRSALKAYAAKHDKAKAVAILKENGAATIGDLAVEKYATVMEAAKVED